MIEKRRAFGVLDVLEMLFFALILNLNAVKVVTRINSTLLVYAVFILFAAVVILNKIQNDGLDFHVDNTMLLMLSLFVLAAIVSMVWTGSDNFSELVKFVAGVIIAYLASQMKWQNQVGGLKTSLLFSFLYSIFLIVRYSWVYATYTSGTTGSLNYLVVTLPVGLGLSLALVFLTMTKTGVAEKVFYIAAIAVQAIALMQYPSRGNLIFPLVLTAVLLVYKNWTKPLRLIVSVIVIVLLVLAMFWATEAFGNDYLQVRMSRLFENQEQEKRVPLYGYLINYILDHMNYIIGQGFGNSSEVLKIGGFHEHYPHNFLLEIIGEMGIFGVALIGTVVVKLIISERRQIMYFREVDSDERKKQEAWFFAADAGLLFYAMTYFKSYSIYDGYQLFIFIAFMLHTGKAVPAAVKSKREPAEGQYLDEEYGDGDYYEEDDDGEYPGEVYFEDTAEEEEG